MRVESSVLSVLSVSWIASEAIVGLPRLPFDLGVTHYDEPPPDDVLDPEPLLRDDRVRFVNQLRAWIEVDGVPTYRLDFAYRRARVVVEYDGEEAHAGREAEDEERRDWLRRNGWTIIVIREGDFTGAALDRWLLRLREALVPSYSNRRW